MARGIASIGGTCKRLIHPNPWIKVYVRLIKPVTVQLVAEIVPTNMNLTQHMGSN
jgi:hypothetical protein